MGEEPHDISAEPALIHAAEAEAVSAAIEQRQAAEMTWADSLGNLTVQMQRPGRP
ncbi:hypothetical protein AB0J35_55310 [Nonomuraea angiospora]|uniref:hypothetical protein n=1 Tax=Nonomuraea angiospora TaxID=46172 RepID=UPI00342F974E